MTKTPIKLKDIEKGDIFSESSHYIFDKKIGDKFVFKQVETDQEVGLDSRYVSNLLSTADQYDQVVKVTKEDKKTGEPGIRSIWENLSTDQVFTVCFRKQDSKITKKEFNSKRDAQLMDAVARIEKAKAGKKGVAKLSAEIIKEVQENPITDIKEGDLRQLRGYKKEFASRDGKYNCIDMDITSGSQVRPVNINTIESLVFNNIKYEVK